MKINGKLPLYVPLFLIITPVLSIALFNATGNSIEDYPVIDKWLFFSMTGGFALLGLWFLVRFFSGVMRITKFGVFLLEKLSRKHKKKLLLVEEEAKRESALLDKLGKITSDKNLSDDELAEKTLALFMEYGINTNHQHQNTVSKSEIIVSRLKNENPLFGKVQA